MSPEENFEEKRKEEEKERLQKMVDRLTVFRRNMAYGGKGLIKGGLLYRY
jgi:hypothetical protein